MSKKKNPKHRLSGVPTVYEETHKLVDSRNLDEVDIDKMEDERVRKHEEAILKLINKHGKSKVPLVERLSIQHETYQEALNNLLSLRSHETFETMMLLFEHMEKKKTFKLDKLTGTELLRLGGYKGTRQAHRNRILRRIESHAGTIIKVLDPEKSIKNYKSEKKDRGLVYKTVSLVKIREIVHSKQNPKLIKELVGVEFLPEYIEYLQQISRRYIPLETIRKIEKESSTDKTRHFLYKLCFKFAGIKKNECQLTLDECMNLGKFYNKAEHSIKRKWKPIEKALEKGKEYKLLEYQWIFRDPTDNEKKLDNLSINLFGVIDNVAMNTPLDDKYYKYIEKVRILRAYNLSAPQINLPFELEDDEAIKPKDNIGEI
jgi:hypothetical protein